LKKESIYWVEQRIEQYCGKITSRMTKNLKFELRTPINQIINRNIVNASRYVGLKVKPTVK